MESAHPCDMSCYRSVESILVTCSLSFGYYLGYMLRHVLPSWWWVGLAEMHVSTDSDLAPGKVACGVVFCARSCHPCASFPEMQVQMGNYSGHLIHYISQQCMHLASAQVEC
jgi:hypothetical protein